MTGVIFCGGKGKRLANILPSGMPKCLLRIGGQEVWRYAEMAARVAGCSRVDIAPGPFVEYFSSHREWVVDEPKQDGALAVASRCTNRPLAVFNGDKILFGEFEIPSTRSLAVVLGRNRVTGRSGEPVFRVVGQDAVLDGAIKLEDVKPNIVVDLSGSVSFIDVGTPQGLAFALEAAKQWCS